MNKKIICLAGIVVLLIIIQFIPVKRTNPVVETPVPAPDNVKVLLQAACFDCHSNETVWPWYSRVAPVSWLVVSDVNDGRKHINFSTWNRLSEQDRVKVKGEIRDEVQEGEMPLAIYKLSHPEARLTDPQRETIIAWTRTPETVPEPVVVETAPEPEQAETE